MGFVQAKNYLENLGLKDRILTFTTSSATVELAAKTLGCAPANIAKSLAFWVDKEPIIIVTAGDAKVDSKAFKAYFKTKAKMLKPEELPQYIGHQMGGVCPFGVREGVKIYLDISLKRFEIIYPACGSINSAVKLTPEELFKYTKQPEWVDLCKEWDR